MMYPTTIELIPLLCLIFVHWFADFVLQTDSMAKNKSSSNSWLGRHILVYSVCLLPFGLYFTIFNGIMHFATDYITSRITKRLWAKQDVHNFFVVIGADQAFHMACLVTSFILFGNPFGL